MSTHLFAGPVFVLAVLALWLLGRSNERVATRLDRVARVLFGRFVSADSRRQRRLKTAHVDTTYRTYAAKTVLYALLALVAGSIGAAYLLAGLLLVFEPVVQALAGLPRTITRPLGITPDFTLELAERTRLFVLVGGGIVAGALTAVLSYVLRWQLPASDAEVRRRGIEAGLPRTTAFMFALSRGGMEFPQILRILADNRDVYGETATEMSITVREMDLFGRDMITALREMSRQTPSEQFKTFAENLTSVLQSGSDLPAFLEEQYERFREEREERQEDVLELLATIAEGYVSVLVAGMLFLVTILLVFGLTTTDTLWLLQLLIYLIIPLSNAAFAVFLSEKLRTLDIARLSGGAVLDRMDVATPVRSQPAGRSVPDGGVAADRDRGNRRVLGLYDRASRVKTALRNPPRTLLLDPAKLLWITVPVAVVAFAVRLPDAFLGDGVAVRVLDDLVVQSVLFLLVTYAVLRYLYKRRIDRLEAATPEFLGRLASLNEAGLSFVDAIERVRGSDLGALTPEIDRIWRDLQYGSNVDDALVRFGRRVRTTAVTRVVVLLTNAMRASGDMGPVLRIASDQARSEVALRRQRRQQMLTYLVVIYISFFVFLVIILAVNEVLVPSLPDAVPTPSGQTAGQLGATPDTFSRFGDVDKAAYTLLFFHAALIQAVAAGFVGGQLGEGSLRDGAKHAAIMLGIAYLAVILLASPVASVSVVGPTATGDEVRIDGVSLSDGGYVAVYDEDGFEGELLGHTGYLPPGSHSDVRIPVSEGAITEDRTVRIVVHRDTDGDQQFEFEQPYEPDTTQVDRPYDTISDSGEPGVSVEVVYLGSG